jgi:hypothetical protein
MEFDVKFKSVAFKWIVNVFLVILLTVIVLEVLLCVFIRSYYLNKAQEIAEEYASAFITPLANCPAADYQSTARQYCEEFQHKDKIEVQILDNSGKIMYSTTGFTPSTAEMPDYAIAESNSEIKYWYGKNAVGEYVLCQTTILEGGEKPSNGAVRWIVSMVGVRRHIFKMYILAIATGAVILLITGCSGIYFISPAGYGSIFGMTLDVHLNS